MLHLDMCQIPLLIRYITYIHWNILFYNLSVYTKLKVIKSPPIQKTFEWVSSGRTWGVDFPFKVEHSVLSVSQNLGQVWVSVNNCL